MSVGMQGRSLDPKRGVATAIAEAQANLERAVEELDRLPALDLHSIALAAHALNNFLTVSGGVVELLIPTHLPRLVERACAYYRRAADAKGIDVKFHAAADVPTVETDRVLVAAVLDNLLSNAVKYSPRDKRIWVDVEPERDGVACRVRDEGPGLSPAEQERLFLPGVRLGTVPSGGEPSSGYGLAIAKRFADQLGGEIACTSLPGQGATFSLWLPRIRPRT